MAGVRGRKDLGRTRRPRSDVNVSNITNCRSFDLKQAVSRGGSSSEEEEEEEEEDLRTSPKEKRTPNSALGGADRYGRSG